jgi:hypothetical protein
LGHRSAVVLAAMIAATCAPPAAPSGTVVQPTSAPAAAASPLATPSPTTTPAASPTPDFTQGAIAQVVTTDLVVRSAPGTGANSAIYRTRLAAPTLLYVFNGPVSADGYDWYLVFPQNVDDLPAYYRVGWVAAAGKDDEPWIGVPRLECPEPTLDKIVVLSELAMLACFGGQRLTLEGWIASCVPASDAIGATVAWSTRCHVFQFGYDPDVAPSPSGLPIYFDGDIGAEPSAERRLSRIAGHFDDPRAATCPDIVSDYREPPPGWEVYPPGWMVYRCRSLFIADHAELIPTP